MYVKLARMKTKGPLSHRSHKSIFSFKIFMYVNVRGSTNYVIFSHEMKSVITNTEKNSRTGSSLSDVENSHAT